MRKVNLSLFSILVLLIGFNLAGCKESLPEQPEPLNTFMLAIIHPPGQIPLDFEADEAIGDFKKDIGLLRIQGTNLWNGKDKIELTVREIDVNTGVTGLYSIGKFEESSSQVKAEYIDGQSVWNARSISGTLNITKFEEAETPHAFILSATFSFEAQADKGKVQITDGEIENAIILQ